MGQFDLLKKDFGALFDSRFTWLTLLKKYFAHPGFRAVVLHRFARALYSSGRVAFARMVVNYSISTTGAEIFPSAEIGGGFVVIHPVGVVVGARTVAGESLTLLQGVTIGENYKHDCRGKYPRLGDNVTVCANAAVLGPIEIGNDSVVAANSVVLGSWPSRSILAGAPARRVGEGDPDVYYWK